MMRSTAAIFLFSFLALTAHATDGVEVNINQSTAQTTSVDVYNECVNDSLNGKTDGECTGVDPDSQLAVTLGCTGAIRSGQNAPKKSVCKFRLIICWKWGHKSLTQAGWAMNQQKHIRNAQNCTGRRDTSGDNAGEMSGFNGDNDTSGSSVNINANNQGQGGGVDLSSLRDANGNPLFDRNGKFIGSDGSTGLGYADGELFNRMKNGESFKDLALNSPMAKGMNKDELKDFTESLNKGNLSAEYMGEGGGDAGNVAGASTNGFEAGADGTATPGKVDFPGGAGNGASGANGDGSLADGKDKDGKN